MNKATPLDTLEPGFQPWMEPGCFIAPPIPGFGYWTDGRFWDCSQDRLIEAIRTDKEDSIRLVAVPEQTRLVAPEEVDFLHDAIVARLRLQANQGWGMPTAALVFCWGLALLALFQKPDAALNWLAMGLLVGGGPVFSKVFDRWRANHYPPVATSDLIAGGRYEAWLGGRTVGVDWVLPIAISVVGVMQIYVGLEDSVAAAALVKAAIWAGEGWRLLTATLLHGSLQHWFSNTVALIVFDTLVARLTDRRVVPAVFLVAALTGSVFSLFGTGGTSVGASGGILGLVGFLGAVLWHRRTVLPTAAFRPVVESAVFVVVLGAVGYRMIDNWAHLGGALAGLSLGACYMRLAPPTLPAPATSRLSPLSWAARAILMAGTVWALIAMGQAHPLP